MPLRVQSDHSQLYFFWRVPIWSSCRCSTRLSMFSRSPTSQPSHLHTVTWSWPNSSSCDMPGWWLGDAGTLPSVSSLSSPSSSSGGALACAAGGDDGARLFRRRRLLGRSCVSGVMRLLTSSGKSSDLAIVSVHVEGRSRAAVCTHSRTGQRRGSPWRARARASAITHSRVEKQRAVVMDRAAGQPCERRASKRRAMRQRGDAPLQLARPDQPRLVSALVNSC